MCMEEKERGGNVAHRATMGVRPTVMGARTGMVALLQMKAMRKAELPSFSFLRNQLSSPCCSSLSSRSAATTGTRLGSRAFALETAACTVRLKGHSR